MRSLTTRCYDGEGVCFARRDGRCEILTSSLSPCSFKKPVREITHGVYYPYNPASCVAQNKDNSEALREAWHEGG